MCSLRVLDDMVQRHKPSHLVTLINADTMPATPHQIEPHFHLKLAMNDIHQPREGLIPPDEMHVRNLIEFTANWDRKAPMIIHCWAGISRSTAAAYVAVCALNPAADEDRIARLLRASSPSATPNPRIVALADKILDRSGRMTKAVEAIGRGRTAMEGEPFGIPALAD
ncbi:MAG: hypothetical protein K8F25_09475 [Fimbriimonadaceae bacterium]|nr:hypothetical protein [Alphaproteobacteria bacterium]